MQAPWWWSKIETCRSDIYVHSNVNFNAFFKIIEVPFLVRELYIYQWTVHISVNCTYISELYIYQWTVHISVNCTYSQVISYFLFMDSLFFIFLIFALTNKCTINRQIFILLLHVSTLLCHPQTICNQFLAMLHNYINAAVGNTICNFTYIYDFEISAFRIFKNIKIVLFVIKWLKSFCCYEKKSFQVLLTHPLHFSSFCFS